VSIFFRFSCRSSDLAKMDSKDAVEDVNLPQIDILQATSICHWYPIFQKDTLKSIFLTLSPEFLKYLSLDGIVLPKSVFTTKFSSATETDESFDDWGSEDPEEDPPCPDFPEFVSQLQAVLDEWEVIVPRSNWGVPKDAEWITPTRSIKCTTVEDIFLLLKASPRLLHDFTSEPYCGAAPPILALRKWYDLNRSMEFRCFSVAKRLAGISQKHCGEYFAHLQSIQEGIHTTILTFFETKIQGRLSIDDYTLDVYLQPKRGAAAYRPFIVAFGPFGASDESPCLFSWKELTQPQCGAPPLRIVHDQRISPSDAAYCALPHDLRTANFTDMLDALKYAVAGQGTNGPA